MNRRELKASLALIGKTQAEVIKAIQPKMEKLGYKSLSVTEFAQFTRLYGVIPLSPKGEAAIELVRDYIIKNGGMI